MKDSFGIEILPTDRVRVNSWGYGARSMDCGTASPVVRINRTRVVIIDRDNRERAVGPTNLGVLRRDGGTGYEGNRPACATSASATSSHPPDGPSTEKMGS